MATTATKVPANNFTNSVDYFVEKISAAWQKQVSSIIETGDWLIRAKAKLEHGDYEAMIKARLPFDPRTAEMLAKVAKNKVLRNPNHGSVLPASWRTLSELAILKLDKKAPDGGEAANIALLEAAIKDKRIHPRLERKDVAAIDPGYKAPEGDGKPSMKDQLTTANEKLKELEVQLASKAAKSLATPKTIKASDISDEAVIDWMETVEITRVFSALIRSLANHKNQWKLTLIAKAIVGLYQAEGRIKTINDLQKLAEKALKERERAEAPLPYPTAEQLQQMKDADKPQ